MHIDGSFQLKLPLGGITIEAEAKLEIDNREKSEQIRTTVTLQSQPRFGKAPTNSQEMMDSIERLDSRLENEKHFPQFDENDKENRVYGVPVGFRLCPITMLKPGEIEMDPTYKVLNANNMEEFTGFVLTLQKFCDIAYIRKLMIDQQPKIIPILLDDSNPITEKIIKYSAEKKALAREIKSEVNGIFIRFKLGEQTADDLINFVKEKEDLFDPQDILLEVHDFIKECRDELNAICTSDSNGIVYQVGEDEDNNPIYEPCVRFFSNKQDLQEWYNPSRTIKILLQTFSAEKPTSTVFLRLYDMCPALIKRGIEVGIALPCISDDFSLTFKSRYDEVPQMYFGQDIFSMLNIMAVAVDEGESITKMFYSVNAALSGLQLPLFENFHDIPNMVTVMNDYRHTIICETYCELRAKLLETQDVWNFILPVQALHTSIEMMRFFRRLRKEIPERFPSLRHRFIVGKFNDVDNCPYSPVLFVLYDDVLKGVCLDHMDILILMEELSKEEPNIGLLGLDRVRESCLYTPRAEFAIKVGQHFSLDHRHTTTDPILALDEAPNNPDPNLASALQITGAACLRDERIILTTAGRLALAGFKEETAAQQLLQTFNLFGWEDNEFEAKKWASIPWADFHKELQQFMSSIAPFLMKVVLGIDQLRNLDPQDKDLDKKIDDIIIFLRDVPPGKRHVKSYQWMGRKIDEDEMYLPLKEEVESYDGLPPTVRRTGILKAFESFVLRTSNDAEFFNVLQIITFVEGMKTEGIQSLKPFLIPVVKRYCQRLEILNVIPEEPNPDTVELLYPRARRRLDDSLHEKQLFKTLGVLSEIQFHPVLYMVHQELYNFTTLPAPTNVKSLLEKLTPRRLINNDDLPNDDLLEIIWTNPKFLHALRQVLSNPGVIDTLYIHALAWSEAIDPSKPPRSDDDLIYEFDSEEVEDFAIGDDVTITFLPFFPKDVVEKIKSLIALRKVPVFDWVKKWSDVETFVEQLQIFVARHQIPQLFLETLRNHVENSEVIKTALKDNDCLYYWNEEDSIFYSPWSVATVSSTVDKLYEFVCCNKKIQNEKSRKPQQVSLTLPEVTNEEPVTPDPIVVNRTWRQFVAEGILHIIEWKQFSQSDGLYPTMTLPYDRLTSFANTMLKNVTQQMRMVNAGILTPTTVAKFINYPFDGPRPGYIDFGQGSPVPNLKLLLTRGDIQNCIFHLTDPVVTHHILVNLAKTPVPLPLSLPSIKDHIAPTQEKATLNLGKFYRLLTEALKNVVVPEMQDILSQHRLFIEPYRFILTLRVGDTKPNPGRSSMLNNYLMREKDMFGSLNDPGKEFGVPVSRDGFTEFIWLSQTTCESSFWYDYIEEEYSSPTKNMILLGALHGDCLDHTGLLDAIRPYVSCFVVFWHVANITDLKKKKALLMGALGQNTKMLDIVLYPDSTIVNQVHEDNLLYKYPEGPDPNRNKVRNVMKEALKFTTKEVEPQSGSSVEKSVTETSIFSSFSALSGQGRGYKSLPTTSLSLELVPSVQTTQSKAFLDFINKHTIVKVHKGLTVEKNPQLISEFNILTANLIRHNNAVATITHFTYELDFISRRSMVEAQARVQTLRHEIEQQLRQAKDGILEESLILSIQEECKWSLDELRWNTLSLQDILRTFWANFHDEDQLPTFTSHYEKLIMASFPFEIFHPTYSNVPFQFRALEAMSGIPSETKIFVISAVGIKNSGKSFLLNRLFGCGGFTEYSTTYGIQARLVWLTEELKKYTDCDAFLIVDTEGVGNPENKIDESADALERKLTTFILGLSNLTLVTAMGSSLKEISSILEISFITSGKLKDQESKVIPDVLVVQQLLPGIGEVDTVPQEFEASLQSSFKAMNEHELKSGIRMRPNHRLHKVSSRQKHEELIIQLRPLDEPENEQNQYYRQYHDDVQQLYERIIHVVFSSKQKRVTFGSWLETTTNLWTELGSNTLQSGFKESTALSHVNNIAFKERVASVKESIEEALRFHEVKAEQHFIYGVDTEKDKEPSLDDIFEKYLNPFDLTLNSKLTGILRELQQAINTCEDAVKVDPGGKRMNSRRRQKLNAAATVNPNACEACDKAFTLREALFAEVVRMKGGFLVEEEINRYTQMIKDSIFEKFRQGLIARQIYERQSDGDLYEKYLAIMEDDEIPDKEEKYAKYLQYISTLQFFIPSRQQFHEELKDVYASLPHIFERHNTEGEHEFPILEPMLAFDVQIYNAALESSVNNTKPEKMTWLQHDWILAR